MSNHSFTDAKADLHARDGHLTMLTMDRFERGELELTLHEAVVEHLDGCGLCADRFDASFRDARRLVPPAGSSVASARASSRWMAATAGLLMAAGLVLVVWPKPQQASLRPASEPTLSASAYTTSTAQEHGPTASIDLRVLAGEQPLSGGDAVAMDELLHVEVSADDHGWVALIVDTAERTEANPDEGADDTGGLAPETNARMLFEPREIRPGAPPFRIAHDVSFDGFVTEERIVAIWCPDPFIVDPADLAHGAELAGLPEGCTSRSIHYVPWGRIAAS
jgi:hypothetical protein